MWTTSLLSPLGFLAPRRQAGPGRHPAARRPVAIEPLEARALPSFLPPVFYGPFLDAGGVAMHDFNNDGVPDLMATSRASTPQSIGVLLGNGDGTFQDPIYRRLGIRTGAVAGGDVNGDGLLDVIATTPTLPEAPDVSLLLGNGDGSLQDPIPLGRSLFLSGLALDDVNGDGLADLITANGRLNRVNVWLSNGDGSFQEPRPYETGAALSRRRGGKIGRAHV